MHVCQSRGIQYVGLDGIVRLPGRGHMDQSSVSLGSQGPMHKPFGIPSGLAGALFGFTEQTQEMRHAKSAETGLRLVSSVRVALIERRVLLKEPNSRIVERYQQTGVRVCMDVDGENLDRYRYNARVRACSVQTDPAHSAQRAKRLGQSCDRCAGQTRP
jgi:hypothetical protein